MLDLCGWTPNPGETDRICQSLPVPIFNTPAPEPKPAFLYRGVPYPMGDDVQQIGDCVSWGWAHLIDILQAYTPNLSFQRLSTEVIYALSRVEIGNRQLGNNDGSVGAWAAKAVNTKGTLSRLNLESLGLNPNYSPQRAKQWGYQGLPDQFEPIAFQHLVQTVSLVRTFDEAAWHIQNGRPVAVCSNVGFDNQNSRTIRDAQGFAKPRGTWQHCMCFIGCRFDRPGLLLLNQWPTELTQGPKYPNDQPDNSWWVDEAVVNAMLSQGDSFTASQYQGYPTQNFVWDL